MRLIDVPETCALAINNMPVAGRPIWRLIESKHIAKLEITWQLPRQPIQRRGNQQKTTTAADGVTSGETSKMAETKMAAPRPDTKMAGPALNVAMCTTLTGPPRTPPGHSTPIAEDTTAYHSLQINNNNNNRLYFKRVTHLATTNLPWGPH